MFSKRVSNCAISILGDSYSTFAGHIPAHQKYYYPRPETVADVLHVSETWWHMLAKRRNYHVLINDSYSGSTVCNHIREDLPPESAFIVRMKETLSNQGICEEKPDAIFIFGCTNDSFLDRRIGQLQYDNWSEDDLRQALPAYCYMLDYVTKQNPQAIIVTIINDMLNPKLHDGMVCASAHYQALCVNLQDIDKSSRHPTKLGMLQICDQVDHMLEMYDHLLSENDMEMDKS